MLILTEENGDPLAVTTFTVERGGGSASKRFRIWNTGLTPVAGAFMSMYAEIIPGSGDFLSKGHPVLDEVMGRFEIVDFDSDVTPGQEIVTGEIQPMGYLANPHLPTILAGNWVVARVQIVQPGISAGGGSTVLKFEIGNDSAARGVVDALTSVARGIETGVNQPLSQLISGRTLLAHPNESHVHILPGSWMIQGIGYTDAVNQSPTLTNRDVNNALLASGESYYATISQGTTLAPTVTKGVKSATPTKPDLPTDKLLIGYVLVLYNGGGDPSITQGNIESDLTYWRYLPVAGTGLSIVVHAGEALTANYRQFHAQKETIVVPANATRYLWLKALGGLQLTDDSPPLSLGSFGAGALPICTVVTDGSTVTTLTDTRIFIGSAGTLTPHAATHATGGSDPVSPGSIGAATVASVALKANLASPTFTGDPKAPTPAPGDDDTSIATTAFVTDGLALALAGYAPLASPVFTGNPTAPTPSPGDKDTSLATTAFVQEAVASGASTNYRRMQQLAGTQDGVNVTFTTPDFFVDETETVFVNGIAQTPAAHYTFVGATGTITFTSAPQPTDNLKGSYFKS